VGEKEGTPHLQGFFTLKNKLSMKAIHKALGSSALSLFETKDMTSKYAALYCKKGEQPKSEWDELKEKGLDFGRNYQGEEFGCIPYQGKRSDLDSLSEAVIEGQTLLAVSNLSPATFVCNYRGLANLQSLHTKPYTHHECRGLWIYGPPGTGKSTRARSFCKGEDLYIKAQNKWWDGYAGQSHVLLDDLDLNCLGHYLKIWADKYACTGEIKCSTVALRHEIFIVTSNFTIQELWGDPPKIEAALRRRFKIEHMTEVVDPVLLAQESAVTTPYLFVPQPPTAILNKKTDSILSKIPSRPLLTINRGRTPLPSQKNPEMFSNTWAHNSKTPSQYKEDADSDDTRSDNDENTRPSG
jgi:RNA helicase